VNLDDVERVRSFQTAFDRAEAKRSTTEFRLQRGDGNLCWVETLGLASRTRLHTRPPPEIPKISSSASPSAPIRNVPGEWTGLETEDLVRAQLAPVVDLIGSRISVHGCKLRLKAAGA
jgi:hypothetical protein